MRVEIKKIADLENALGKILARNLLKTVRRETLQTKPRSVEFVAQKPAMFLGDGDTLHAYGADLDTGEITGERYCGSAESAINHPEQGYDGNEAPKGFALIFVHAYWNGINHSWTVTVVSNEKINQIGR